MADIDFDIGNLPTDEEIEKMFAAVPELEKHHVSEQVVKVGGKVIVKRARQLTPRSTASDRNKRSKNQKNEADWNTPLWKTIAMVVRKYRVNGLAVIGPKWPKGNKAYFNTSPKGRRQVLWGLRTGKTLPQTRNWIVQAFDGTRTEQLSAMKLKLKELMDDIWLNK